MSKSIFLIAGEHSGDALGGPLIAALKTAQPDIKIEGVGGPKMQEQGLKSLVPMSDLCVMGIVEIARHYPRLRKLGFHLIEEIERRQPDILITIDLPDFNFAIAKQLKKRGIFKGKIIHHVAPTVWAWRPGRAKKISKFLDGLLCLFPFEPPYFTAHGLKAEYVGHSLIESGIDKGNGDKFRQTHGIPKDTKTIGLFFGSRRRELKTMGPILKKVLLELYEEENHHLYAIVPTLMEFEHDIHALLSDVGIPCTLTTHSNEKWDAFKACDAALAVSGTVGLELAYAGVPHVIAYKMNPLTWLVIKQMIKTRFAHLANIMLGKEAIPEFIQGNCVPKQIADTLENLLKNPETQKPDLEKIHTMLGQTSPAQKAAEFILSQTS